MRPPQNASIARALSSVASGCQRLLGALLDVDDDTDTVPDAWPTVTPSATCACTFTRTVMPSRTRSPTRTPTLGGPVGVFSSQRPALTTRQAQFAMKPPLCHSGHDGFGDCACRGRPR